MEPKVNYVLVGSFVVLLGAALLGLVLWLGKGDYRGTYDHYYSYMRESVSGLSVDAAVKYQGVNVGRVKEIVLSPEIPEEVRLTLDVVRGTPVKEDTVAVLETQGLTGLRTVNLTGGSRGSPPLVAKPGEPYTVIKSRPSFFLRVENALSRLLADEGFPRLLVNLSALTEDARVVVDEQNRRALKRILADLANVTGILAAHRAELAASIVTGNEALKKIAALSKKMDQQLPEIMGEASKSIRSFQNMTQEIARTSASIESTLEANRANLDQFTGQTLGEAGLLVAELRQLTATAQALVQELERQPSALIFGRARPTPGPGE
jgi:phospholipid/cholesterol/gamma-HCH transport system substrate-binding protein